MFGAEKTRSKTDFRAFSLTQHILMEAIVAQDSDDHREIDNGEVVVKANTEERQAVEVRPMRYVLGVGLIAVIVGLAIVYASFTA